MQDKIPQTLDEYIERNHGDDYNWIVLSEVTRRALAAYEIVDGHSHNLQDAVEYAEITAEASTACHTAQGFAVSPRLLAAAVENRAAQALAWDDEKKPDEALTEYLTGVLDQAQALLQNKED